MRGVPVRLEHHVLEGGEVQVAVPVGRVDEDLGLGRVEVRRQEAPLTQWKPMAPVLSNDEMHSWSGTPAGNGP